MDIILFVLVRFSPETSRLCFSSSIYIDLFLHVHMIKINVVFTRKSVDCSGFIYAIVRLNSGKTMVSILHVDLISWRYFQIPSTSVGTQLCRFLSLSITNTSMKRKMDLLIELF